MNMIITLLRPLFILILVIQSVKNEIVTNHSRVHRFQRTVKPNVPSCNRNQYFDKEEGRCLGVAGGGKVLFINYTKSCGANILKPHCTQSNYYYICKRNKTILAQCAKGQNYDNRLQRCVDADPSNLTSQTIRPEEDNFDHIEPPPCKKPGRFPLPGYCKVFYTCETNGHQLFQNVLKCPEGKVFEIKNQKCSSTAVCEENHSSLQICVPSMKEEEVLDTIETNDMKIDETTIETFTTESYATTLINQPDESTFATSDYESSAKTEHEDREFTSRSDTDTEFITPESTGFTDNYDITTHAAQDFSEMSRSTNIIDRATTASHSTNEEYATTEKSKDYANIGAIDESSTESVEVTNTDDPILGEQHDVTDANEEISSTTRGTTEYYTNARQSSIADLHEVESRVFYDFITESTYFVNSDDEDIISSWLTNTTSEDTLEETTGTISTITELLTVTEGTSLFESATSLELPTTESIEAAYTENNFDDFALSTTDAADYSSTDTIIGLTQAPFSEEEIFDDVMESIENFKEMMTSTETPFGHVYPTEESPTVNEESWEDGETSTIIAFNATQSSSKDNEENVGETAITEIDAITPQSLNVNTSDGNQFFPVKNEETNIKDDDSTVPESSTINALETTQFAPTESEENVGETAITEADSTTSESSTINTLETTQFAPTENEENVGETAITEADSTTSESSTINTLDTTQFAPTESEENAGESAITKADFVTSGSSTINPLYTTQFSSTENEENVKETVTTETDSTTPESSTINASSGNQLSPSENEENVGETAITEIGSIVSESATINTLNTTPFSSTENVGESAITETNIIAPESSTINVLDGNQFSPTEDEENVGEPAITEADTVTPKYSPNQYVDSSPLDDKGANGTTDSRFPPDAIKPEIDSIKNKESTTVDPGLKELSRSSIAQPLPYYRNNIDPKSQILKPLENLESKLKSSIPKMNNVPLSFAITNIPSVPFLGGNTDTAKEPRENTVSTYFGQPIASALLNITDKLERRVRNKIIRMLEGVANSDK